MMPETKPQAANLSSETPSDLRSLAAAISALPREQAADLLPLLDRVIEGATRRRRILTLVQDALSQLRLDMKYLMFDLEATRRERDSFRQKLSELED